MHTNQATFEQAQVKQSIQNKRPVNKFLQTAAQIWGKTILRHLTREPHTYTARWQVPAGSFEMLPLMTNGFSSHHLSLPDQKPFPPCELPPLSQTQVIFTPAHSFTLTASASGFRVREGGSLSRSSVCGKAQSPLLLPVDRLRTPPTKMKLQDPSFSGDELPSACRHCPPPPPAPQPGAWLTLVVKVRDRSSSRCLSCCSLAYRRCWKFLRAVCRCWTSYFNWSTRLELMDTEITFQKPRAAHFERPAFVFKKDASLLLPTPLHAVPTKMI